MTYFFIITAVSFAGMAVITLRRVFEIRAMPAEVISQRIAQIPPLQSEIYSRFSSFLRKSVKENILPRVYAGAEKTVGWVRALILKIEQKLEDFSDYLRGKRELKNGAIHNGNGKNGEYWTEIHEHKNGTKSGEDN